jgi:hypothetical protein
VEWAVVSLSPLLKHHSQSREGSAVLLALQLEAGVSAKGSGVEDLAPVLA